MSRNPNLRPNVFYNCKICGKAVARYMTPCDQKRYPPLYCSRACAGVAHRGASHHMWNGGRCINDQGYVMVYCPNHPYVDQRGYVREHRLVMEGIVGRYLLPEEVVHHENDDPGDNRPENLRLFASQAEHKAYEMRERRGDDMGRMLPIGGAA